MPTRGSGRHAARYHRRLHLAFSLAPSVFKPYVVNGDYQCGLPQLLFQRVWSVLGTFGVERFGFLLVFDIRYGIDSDMLDLVAFLYLPLGGGSSRPIFTANYTEFVDKLS